MPVTGGTLESVEAVVADPGGERREALAAALGGRTTTWSRWVPVGDRRLFFYTRFVPDLAPDGAVIGAVAVVTDLTEQQRVADEATAALVESERRFGTLAETATDVIMLMGPDSTIHYASPAARTVLGVEPAAYLGRRTLDLVAEADARRAQETWDAFVRDGVEPGPIRLRVDLDDHTRHWVEVNATVIREDGSDTAVEVRCSVRDVTAEVQAEEALRSSEQRHRSLVEGLPLGVVRVTPDLRILYGNPRAGELLGEALLSRPGAPLAEVSRFGGERVPFWQAVVDRAIDAGEPHVEEIEVHTLHGPRWTEVHVIPEHGPDGAVASLLLVGVDVDERHRSQEELARRAMHDPLTGLANRALAVEHLGRALGRLARQPGQVAVLFCDLDRFKDVNDALGHAVGDHLLVAVARRLGQALRPSDLLARMGGDEFVTVLDHLGDPAEAARAATRLLDVMRAPLLVDGHELHVTTSIGIALSDGPGTDPGELVANADTAMYEAKEHGRNRFELFDETLRSQVVQRLELEAELRRALERGELEVHYQPEIDLHTGSVVAVEALARWRRPDGTRLSAQSFIPLAEETGLIRGIGDWVLRGACAEAGRWHRARPDQRLPLRVNVSAEQLDAPGYAATVRTALDESGLEPGALCIEVPVEALDPDSPTRHGELAAVRALGVGLAVQRVGSGWTSLVTLQRTEPDVFKVGRSLVAGLPVDPDAEAVIGAVVALAKRVHRPIVATGVEREAQADALRALGCDAATGLLYSPPLPADEIDALLAARA
ncbi:MAG: EAL domain-containing protein [Acidimicrobiales bacterium]|nr:EAL domain-containing protein [Acidimicrobiales bacterium]